ncbi:unnamed protein product [Rotaria magnacalcarata]|uniref:Melanin-concentrating hormone n=2 Tax=Rotaria magnacalcarata TaxID=392030 RepID=A0A816AKH2_9BILA|nr:unnamed protein product [Rotaria magnacalcarata]CAF1596948.1 unnamed protein product [Rotaria magnacalcarata]CAF2147175.1 unnamed protein product [Rotaria magnacalcarata]CAF4328415.1 unnamed protein product [Rotaria magnacalcarata]
MASGFSTHILLFLCAFVSLTLTANSLASTPATINNNNNHNRKTLFFLHKNSRPKLELDSNLSDDSSAVPSTRSIQQRNVIMPRICYFVRVPGTTVYQRLCLPYNDRK